MQNQSRLRVLKKREDLIKTVIEESLQKLIEVTKDPELYNKVLQLLISQSLFRLFEKEVVVCCRQQDLKLIENLIAPVKKQFTDATKRDVIIKIDKEKFLPANSYVIVTKGKSFKN